MCFLAQSVFVLLEFRPLHHAVVATYGELYKRGRPLRELQDQVGVVVFHFVDSLHLRIPQESLFFAVAFMNELLRRRFRPNFSTIAFATCLAT